MAELRDAVGTTPSDRIVKDASQATRQLHTHRKETSHCALPGKNGGPLKMLPARPRNEANASNGVQEARTQIRPPAACGVKACQHPSTSVWQSLAVQTVTLPKLLPEPCQALHKDSRDWTLISSHLAADVGLRGAHQGGKGWKPVWPERSRIDGIGHSKGRVIASAQTPWQRDSLQPTVALVHSVMSAWMLQSVISAQAGHPIVTLRTHSA